PFYFTRSSRPPRASSVSLVNSADGPDYGKQVNSADGPDYGKKVNFADGPDYGKKVKKPDRENNLNQGSGGERADEGG
ncbi:hypothetical protein ELO52_28215, partial [Klebsiella pneumoniae]|nr:hypothetical protein [Klebsiella pneumoniae]